MEPDAGRLIVMPPDAVAAATIVLAGAPHAEPAANSIACHDFVLFLARGEGEYRANGRAGTLRPNTLLTVPAGPFSCSLSSDREMYVLALRTSAQALRDQQAYLPSLEYRLSPAEGRTWRDRMATYVDRVSRGDFSLDEVDSVKRAVLPYLWHREHKATSVTLRTLFDEMWERVAQPLSLEQLAASAGYSPNHLNDLYREYTGRTLGRSIADMRMARARATLEHTDLPIADVGLECGYEDPAYFARAFRNAHCVTPATWRIAARPDDARHAAITISIDELHEVASRRTLGKQLYSFAR